MRKQPEYSPSCLMYMKQNLVKIYAKITATVLENSAYIPHQIKYLRKTFMMLFNTVYFTRDKAA